MIGRANKKRNVSETTESKETEGSLFQRMKNAKLSHSLVTTETKMEGGSLILVDEKEAVSSSTRTSGLKAANMELTGHQAGVYNVKFSPEGKHIASCGHDKNIFLWDTYEECTNYGVLKGHESAVLDVCWSSDETQLYSASSDKTAAIWDLETQTRIKKLKHHTAVVNSVSASRRGEPLLATASDDCWALLYDTRTSGKPQTRYQHQYPLTSVAFSDDSFRVYTAGLEEVIHCWDRRTEKILFVLQGHSDTITGLAVSPDGTKLLSNSMDSTLRTWDIQPYIAANKPSRLLHTYTGAQHDFQKIMLRCSWSSNGGKISCGSSDGFVHVWDVTSGRMLYKLPGHTGAVCAVDFHPKEPIIVSCSSDKKLLLGEIMA